MENKVISKSMMVVIFLFTQIFYLSAIADTPIIHIQHESLNDKINEDSFSLTKEERITQLEKKIEFINRINLVEDVNNMKKKIQQLEGLLEVQAHALEQLADQQKKFYTDVDHRLTNLSTMKPMTHSDSPIVLPVLLPEKKIIPIKETIDKNSVSENVKSSPSPSSFIPLISSSFNEQEKKNNPIIDKTAYENAYRLMSTRHYDQAILAFSHFINLYPKSNYLANAHYWLGEIYIQQGKKELAMNEFIIIKNNFADHYKIADAKYKIGILKKSQGNLNAAQDEFMELIKHYHGTSASQLAVVQLRHLT